MNLNWLTDLCYYMFVSVGRKFVEVRSHFDLTVGAVMSGRDISLMEVIGKVNQRVLNF